MNIEDRFEMTIAGEAATSSARIEVINPANGEVFATAPNCGKDQLDDAVSAARRAFQSWRATSIDERSALLKKAGDALKEHAEELSRLFTREQGRPIDTAREEIIGSADWLHAVSEMRPAVQVVEDSPSQFIEVRHVPLGVVCAIAPWNFPITLAIWKVAPALLTGNTMVWKPSPFTPLVSLKIGELFREIFPPGVLNVISGDDDLGPLMTAHPGFDKISFTGSTATGKKVMQSASRDLKRLTLELSGNDVAIVMPDVDLDEVAEHLFFGAFFNTAQVCIATKRLYIHADIYEDLRDRLAAIAKAIKVGDGSEEGTVLGPLQNKRQYERVLALLDDAKKSGAALIQGAQVPDNGGYFIPVTLVDNPPESSRVVQEEAFGPVLPLLKFNDIDEVIARANNCDSGLAGAVWSGNTDLAMDIARRLETGTVWINHNLNVRPDTPFAGHKQSGLGMENGMDGILEYTVPQAVYLAHQPAS